MYDQFDEFKLDDLKGYLPQYVESITVKSKGGLYNCPLCKSGTIKNKTGAFKLYSDTKSWFCHSCHKGGDLFALIREYEEINDFVSQVKRAADFAGVDIEDLKITSESKPKEAREVKKVSEKENKPTADFTSYYRQCAEHATDPEPAAYLKKRGISPQTVKRFMIGYDAKEKRVIIPVTKSFYIARAAAGQDPKYKNPAGQAAQIFNASALHKDPVVFITEGSFDALSVIEAGGAAIALNSTSNGKKLIELLKAKPPKAQLVLCLDNDDSGQKEAAELGADLTKLNVSFTGGNICGSYKDPNERLNADRDGLVKAVQKVIRNILKPDSISSYLIGGYDADRRKFKEGGKATGFKRWDKLTGGLHKGIYMLAAVPGSGKTTIAWQICENLAEAGSDCLYFTLEQTKLDFATKSIIRRIKLSDMDTGATIEGVKDGTIKADKEIRQIQSEIGDRISLIEGNFSLSAKDICDRIEVYIHQTGKKPVVFIDYLQALKPLDDNRRSGNRESIEDTADLLSELKNKHDITMIIISSVSRANYRAALDIDALKESGRLEFSADAVYTLEYSCIFGKYKDLFTSDGDINKKKAVLDAARTGENGIRRMVLRCLKSRYCNPGAMSEFKYYPGADLFVETNTGEFEPAQKSEVYL